MFRAVTFRRCIPGSTVTPGPGFLPHSYSSLPAEEGERASRLLAERLYDAAHGHPDRARPFAALAASFDPRWRADQVPVPPLNGRRLVAEALAFFEPLRVYAPGSY
jgi:hypothetical protein